MPSSLKSISNVKNKSLFFKNITPLPDSFTSTTINISNVNGGYTFQNGNYITSSSSNYNSSYQSFLAYNGNVSVSIGDSWVSMENSYNVVTGECITTTTTTLDNNIVLKGEWLGIKLPNPLIISAYELLVRSVDMMSFNKNTGPTVWSIIASNTGIDGSWVLLDSQTVSSSLWHLKTVPIIFSLIPVPMTPYSYYRIVVQKAGTQYSYLGIKQFNLLIH